VTIKRSQSNLKDILDDSPSLQNFFQEIYLNCYQEALENMQLEYDADFPDLYSFPDEMNQLLDSKLGQE
jgi:hypothetical protein